MLRHSLIFGFESNDVFLYDRRRRRRTSSAQANGLGCEAQIIEALPGRNKFVP
jgi:hypothetical protein